MSTDSACIARQRSSASPVIFEYFTPASGFRSNVVTNGHWWYSNIPAYIEHDARARLQAVPKTKQIGYYSDMYKLEFALPKYNMYRRVLARILAEDFVRTGVYSETQALELARLLLRENVRRIFKV